MSSISGNFNAMPMSNNGVSRFNNSPTPTDSAGIPRQVQAQEGDTFTPMAMPTDKSVFPVASTAIGAGVGLVGGGIGSAFLEKDNPTELKAKAGKADVVKIEDDVVKHNGYTYQMEKVDGKYGVRYRPTVDISGIPYEVHDVSGIGTKANVLKFNGKYEPTLPAGTTSATNRLSSLTQDIIDGLSLKNGHEVSMFVGHDMVAVVNKGDKNTPKLIFDIVKDTDGKSSLKISEDLQKIIDDNDKFPDITKPKMEAIRDSQFAKHMKVFEANDKLPTLQNPEAIENLLHGAGRKWGVIAAITAGTVAAGAGIGYLAGNKKPQPQPEPPVMG